MNSRNKAQNLFSLISASLVLTALSIPTPVWGESFTPLTPLLGEAFRPAEEAPQAKAAPVTENKIALPNHTDNNTDISSELFGSKNQETVKQEVVDKTPAAHSAAPSGDVEIKIYGPASPAAERRIQSDYSVIPAVEEQPAVRVIRAPKRKSEAAVVEQAIAQSPVLEGDSEEILPYSFPVEQVQYNQPVFSGLVPSTLPAPQIDQPLPPEPEAEGEYPLTSIPELESALNQTPGSVEQIVEARDEFHTPFNVPDENVSPKELPELDLSQPNVSVSGATAYTVEKTALPETTPAVSAPIVPVPAVQSLPDADADLIPDLLKVQPTVKPADMPLYPEVDGANPQYTRDDPDYDNLRTELLGEVEKHAWRSGDFQVIPYGFFWTSVSYESHPTQVGSSPFFVQPPAYNGSQCHVDYRGSIFGFNVRGPKLSMFPEAKINGKLEFDLQRTIDYENKTTVHLRHCYVEAISDQWRLLIGQTWDVVSPLVPGTILYSAGWLDGNAGYRRCQLRLERFCNVSPHFQWKLQGCLSAPFAGVDNSQLVYDGQNFRVKDGAYPIVQGRIAAVMGCRNAKQKPMEIGLSAHVGEMQYGKLCAGEEDENYHVKTWGVFLDAYVPINSVIGIQGELFKGENLSMFLAGIGQGVTLDSNCQPEAVQTQGGWINMWLNITDKLQWRVGYMIDDPSNSFEHTAGYATKARTLNHNLFTNVKYNITPKWWVGAEYNHIETDWAGADPGVSACDRVDLVSYFGF